MTHPFTRAMPVLDCSDMQRSIAFYRDKLGFDPLYAEYRAHGVAVPEPPENRPYNCREFVVDDPDGHMLAFGQVIMPDPLGPGLSTRIGRDKEVGS